MKDAATVTPPPVPQTEPMELPSQRTATSDTYVDPDGKYRTRYFASPINFWDGSGWQPIDNSLVADTNGYRNAGGDLASRFAFTADASSLEHVSSGGHDVQVGLVGAAAAFGQPSGDEVSYPNVSPGVDLQYEQRSERVKERLVFTRVPTAGEPTSFSFTLTLDPGLSAVQEADGSIRLIDDSGATVFSLPATTLTDSSSDPETQEPASGPSSMTLGHDGNQWTVTVNADRSWLSDPSRVYPVTLDPTIISWIGNGQASAADTTVNSATPDTNFNLNLDGSFGYYRNRVGFQGAATGENIAYLDFNLSSLSGMTVSSAQLNLYWYHVSGSTSAQLEYGIRRLTDCGWNANDTTWNNRPSQGTDGFPAGATNGQITSTDITSWAAGWANGTMPACGIQIDELAWDGWNGSTGDHSYFKEFASTEDGHTLGSYGSVGPSLDVTYLGNPLTMLGDDPYVTTDAGVNTASGDYTTTATDLSEHAMNLSLAVTRTYNSMDTRTGLFGVGWSSEFDSTASEQPQGITFVMPDGSREFYPRQPGNTFTPPLGHAAKILVANNAILMTDRKFYQYVWNETTGKLINIVDPDGNQLQLHYSGSPGVGYLTDAQMYTCGHENGSDCTMHAGRQLSFHLSSGGFVVWVTTDPVTLTPGWSPQVLKWTYDYAGGASNYLWHSCDPANPVSGIGSGSTCTTYGYSSGELVSIQNANGNYPVRLGYYAGTGGQVHTREDGANHTWTYVYDPFDPFGCPGGAYTTTINDPKSNATNSVYDALGRLVCHVPPGTYGTTKLAYDANGFLFSVEDGNHHTRYMWNDADGNVTKLQDENTWITYNEYTSGDLTAALDARSSSAMDATYRTTYSYWPDHQLHTRSVPGVGTESWTYTVGGETAVGGGFVPAGLLSGRTTLGHSHITYFYDRYGDLAQTLQQASVLNQLPEVDLETDYVYDQFGRVTSKAVHYTAAGGVATVATTAYTFDKATGQTATETDPAVTNPVTNQAHQQVTTTQYRPWVCSSDLAPLGAVVLA